MPSPEMTRRTLLRLGLAGAPAAVVLLRGGGRALASPASAGAALDPQPYPGQDLATFGRMFPQLQPFVPDAADPVAALAGLADAMLEPGGGVDSTHGAAYTYALQVLDHDVTLDLQPQPDQPFSFAGSSARDPLLDPAGNIVYDFESKKIDLSMVYGGGPGLSPQLYQADGLHFQFGPNANGVVDLPRRADGSAVLVETRDDENQILSQLHLALLSFHNNLVDALGYGPHQFAQAQREVVRYWQWAVLNDVMPLAFGPAVIGDLLAGNHRIYDPGADVRRPVMPVEFSVAAYRFGHSYVRNAYALNPVISPNNKPARNTLFAGVAGATGPASPGTETVATGDLHGGVPLTLPHQIDWRQFHEALFDPSVPGASLQVLKQPGGADGLHMIGQSMFGQPPGTPLVGTGAGMPIGGPSGVQPTGSNSIAFRDLIRGFFYQLPSGQDVAQAYGLPPLDPAVVIPASIPGFDAGTPLFFYVLYEAFQANQGTPQISDFDNTGTAGDNTQVSLGPVGARICADVLLRLIELDPHGILNGSWQPAPPVAPAPGQFGLADLLAFAGVVASGTTPAPALGQLPGPQA